MSRPVRIGIIDSGVHVGHPHIGNIAGGVSIGSGLRHSSYMDGLGHGTAIAALCLDHDMDLINLSLGTTNQEHRAAFLGAIARVQAMGKGIVSAFQMHGSSALPGSLAGVVGVVADTAQQPGEHGVKKHDGKNVFAACPFPRDIPGVPRGRNLHGVSFAVAHVTAALAELGHCNAHLTDWESSLVQHLVTTTQSRFITAAPSEKVLVRPMLTFSADAIRSSGKSISRNLDLGAARRRRFVHAMPFSISAKSEDQKSADPSLRENARQFSRCFRKPRFSRRAFSSGPRREILLQPLPEPPRI
jgi:hypothetical protein